jgi:hypothetical protein
LGMQKGWCLQALFHMVKSSTQHLHIPSLETCWSISEGSTSKKCCRNPPSTWRHTTTPKFENTGSNHKTWMIGSSPPTIRPTSCSLTFPHLQTPKEMPSWRNGLGMMTKLLKMWLWIQNSNQHQRGYMFLFIAGAKLLPGGWRLCRKTRYVIHPPGYLTRMFK